MVLRLHIYFISPENGDFMSCFNNKSLSGRSGYNPKPYNFGYSCPICKPPSSDNRINNNNFQSQNQDIEEKSESNCNNDKKHNCKCKESNKYCNCECKEKDSCACEEKEECECPCAQNSCDCPCESNPPCPPPCSQPCCPCPTPEPPIPPTPETVLFTVLKVDAVTNEPLQEATFTLTGVTDVQTQVTDAQGNATFTILTNVTYTLIETEPPTGYRADMTIYSILADSLGRIWVDGQEITGALRIENQAINDLGFSFLKTDASTDFPLEGATFTLSQSTGIIATSTSGPDGLIAFDNLFPGSYELQEVTTPTGYQPNPTIYEVIIFSDGSIEIDNQPVSLFSVSNIPIVPEIFTVTYFPNNPEVGESPVLDAVVGGSTYTIRDNPFTTSANVFVFWNTQPDGSGISYAPSDIITITEDFNLYAIWQSREPTVDTVQETASFITGSGIPGSTISLLFPNSATTTTTVEPSGTWIVPVPPSELPLIGGSAIEVTQTEPNMIISNPVIAIVQRSV